MILETLGFSIGLLYLWWEYHADARVWLASIIMPAISMWIYFSKGIYADFAINVYYLLMGIYGYFAWTRRGGRAKKSEKQTLPITHAPLWGWACVVIATAALWYLLYYVLFHFTDSTVPVLDAFTTALSIVATWMMTRKWAEQWLAWLVVDVVSVYLYISKGLVFYPVLYGIYCVIAVFGYRKWLRLMKQQPTADAAL